jgi:hypothetical protein
MCKKTLPGFRFIKTAMPANPDLVIYFENSSFFWTLSGSITLNVLPLPCILSTSICPPNSSIELRQSVSPRPVPSLGDLVVKKGSNI